ncbi:Peroxyureidoacrylate/ureidoacrylate amidohydrolase RutB [bacterium HR37]|jgi:ureidoacrylate peracid hydrolase|nr:Peroxyureidoacrylate/ureidoacrylate amidohydrolase RutB [bacterium HR37]
MKINPVLLVVDMQNGFCSKGGSFDKFGFNIKPYRAIIPNIRRMIDYMRGKGVPIYYSKAIREASGIDLIDKVHKIIPESRRERLEKMHLCIRDTWDSDIVDELKPEPEDYIVEKRRDSVFQDTEFELWLKALRADTIVFTGIDTYICVESTVRDAFNKGYDVILLRDCVASRNQKHHENTLEQIAEAYGLVLNSDELISMIENEELKLCFKCK